MGMGASVSSSAPHVMAKATLLGTGAGVALSNLPWLLSTPSGYTEPLSDTLAQVQQAGGERDRWVGRRCRSSEASSPGKPQRVMAKPQHAPLLVTVLEATSPFCLFYF